MKPIKSATFGGDRFRVEWATEPGDDGACHYPDWEGDEEHIVKLRPDQTDLQLMDTAIHEALHAEFRNWFAEKVVRMVAIDIARYLWRLGFRRTG